MKINPISFKGTFELNRNKINPKDFVKVLNYSRVLKLI